MMSEAMAGSGGFAFAFILIVVPLVQAIILIFFYVLLLELHRFCFNMRFCWYIHMYFCAETFLKNPQYVPFSACILFLYLLLFHTSCILQFQNLVSSSSLFPSALHFPGVSVIMVHCFRPVCYSFHALHSVELMSRWKSSFKCTTQVPFSWLNAKKISQWPNKHPGWNSYMTLIGCSAIK